MEIKFFRSPNLLPFWSNDKPKELREELILGKHFDSWESVLDCETHIPMRDTWVWPILMGLHTLEIPALAHVSAFYKSEETDNTKEGWGIADLVYIEISSLPKEKNGQFFVRNLMEGRESERTIAFSSRSCIANKKRSFMFFWSDFFEKELQRAKRKAMKEMRNADKEMLRARTRVIFLSGIIP